MKKYSTYKNSGVEWIGEIPEDWVSSKLKLVSEIVTGNTPSTSNENNYTENQSGYVWVKPTYLNSFIPVLDSEQKLTEEGIKSTRKVPKGSVMICCIGNTLGRFGVAGKDLCTNQQINSVVAFTERLDNGFCKFYASLISSELIKFANFVTLPILTKTGLGDIPIILPSFEEQKSIAHYLDQKTTIIDTLLEKTKQKITTLQEQRTAIINQAVTKGLTHLPPAEGGTKGVPLKNSGVEWIGEIPEHWIMPDIKKLIQKGSIEHQDGNHGELHPTANDYVDYGIPFIMASNVSNGNIDFKKCKKLAKQLTDKLRIGFSKEGDVLLTHKGTVGNTAIVSNLDFDYIMLTPQVTYYRTTDENLLNKFIYFFFNSDAFKTQIDIIASKGSTRAYIGLIQQKELKMVTPPIKEQISISNYLDGKTTELDTLIQKEKQRIKLLKEYRQSLISEVVTGKLCVLNEIPIT